MLQLSCERGQKVVVGCEGITVTVLEVRGDRVRLGISAPAGCEVHRQEVWQPHKPEPSQDGTTTPAA
jgi:carbon storage regulator